MKQQGGASSIGTYEDGNIGALTRWVPTGGVARAVPLSRGKPISPKESGPPRVVELLRKDIERQVLLRSGKIVDQADIARREGITRARVTQVMGMLRLVSRDNILSMPNRGLC